MSMSDIVTDAYLIRDAIKNEGPESAYHQRVMRRHRREWPLLWQRLDMLLESIKEYERDYQDKQEQ